MAVPGVTSRKSEFEEIKETPQEKAEAAAQAALLAYDKGHNSFVIQPHVDQMEEAVQEMTDRHTDLPSDLLKSILKARLALNMAKAKEDHVFLPEVQLDLNGLRYLSGSLSLDLADRMQKDLDSDQFSLIDPAQKITMHRLDIGRHGVLVNGQKETRTVPRNATFVAQTRTLNRNAGIEAEAGIYEGASNLIDKNDYVEDVVVRRNINQLVVDGLATGTALGGVASLVAGANTQAQLKETIASREVIEDMQKQNHRQVNTAVILFSSAAILETVNLLDRTVGLPGLFGQKKSVKEKIIDSSEPQNQ